ncbi:MAG: RNA polymerase sigma factor [Myxococcota bacterium]
MTTEPPLDDGVLEDEEFRRRLVELRESLLRFARRRAGVWGEADDLLQETFARALTKRHLYRTDGNLYSWLCTMLVNIQRTRLSKASAQREVLTADVSDYPEHPPTSRTWRDELCVEDIRQALQEVPQPFREAFELYHFERMDQKSIAERQGTDPTRVSKRVASAKRRIRAILLSRKGNGS